MIFRDYKCVGVEKYKKVFEGISIPICLIGPKHSGKTTLIKNYFPKVIFVYNIKDIPEYINAYFHNVLCIRNVDTLSLLDQKVLAVYVEKYISVCQFLLTCNTFRLYPKIIGLCMTVKVLYPSMIDIITYIKPIVQKEQVSCVLDSFEGKSYHDILLELTLLKHCKDPKELQSAMQTCETICKNITQMSYIDIRKEIHILFLLRENFTDIIKQCCAILFKTCEYNDKFFIIEQAAKYQYNMIKGNKDIYHLEAFLFSIKNRLQNNEQVSRRVTRKKKT